MENAAERALELFQATDCQTAPAEATEAICDISRFGYHTLTVHIGLGIERVASTQAGVPATQSHVSVYS